MRPIKMMGLALVVMLAIAAVGAGAASAAKTLHLTRKDGTEPLRPGDEFKMVNDGEWTVDAGGGAVTCTDDEEEQGLVGTLNTNNGKTDEIGNLLRFGQFSDGNRPCASSIPALGPEVFPSGIEYNGDPFGTLDLGSNLKAVLHAKSAVSPSGVRIVRTAEEYCNYTFTKLDGHVSGMSTGFGDRLEISFDHQKMTLSAAGSLPVCPKKAYVTMSFQFQITHSIFYVFYYLS
jgi:hypothetical protein